MPFSAVLFNDYCNIRCEYCLGNAIIKKGVSKNDCDQSLKDLDMKEIEIIMQYLKNDKQGQFRILGGEPTLHSHFKEALNLILKKGFHIHIFTNGTFDYDIGDFLNRIDRDRISLTVNLNSPKKYTRTHWDNINKNLELLKGKKIIMAYNINEINFEYAFIIQLARKYGIDEFSLSIAMSGTNLKSACLRPLNYKNLVPRILKFAEKSRRFNIKWFWNCCLPLCLFKDYQLDKLPSAADYYIPNKCDTGLTIGPGLKVWTCLGVLPKQSVKLTDFDSLLKIRVYYEQKFAPFRRIGGYDKCFNCKHIKQGKCQGGCLGYIINSFNRNRNKSSL